MSSRSSLMAMAVLIAGILLALPTTLLAQTTHGEDLSRTSGLNPLQTQEYKLISAQPYHVSADYIDAIATGESPIDDAGDGNEPPFWATREGLRPDPERPGQTMARDHYRGNPLAPIAVIEFSDYQCPYSRRHNQQTQPVLDAAFVDTDQVFWVFKHFPLSIHPQARMAAAAAECAAEQGKFWDMHDLLFDETDAWSVNDPAPALNDLAQQLQLNATAFAACLADDGPMTLIDSDRADGAAFVRGTPTFIVLYDDQGSVIPGALPVDAFSERLQEIIDSLDFHLTKIFLPLLQR